MTAELQHTPGSHALHAPKSQRWSELTTSVDGGASTMAMDTATTSTTTTPPDGRRSVAGVRDNNDYDDQDRTSRKQDSQRGGSDHDDHNDHNDDNDNDNDDEAMSQSGVEGDEDNETRAAAEQEEDDDGETVRQQRALLRSQKRQRFFAPSPSDLEEDAFAGESSGSEDDNQGQRQNQDQRQHQDQGQHQEGRQRDEAWYRRWCKRIEERMLFLQRENLLLEQQFDWTQRRRKQLRVQKTVLTDALLDYF